MLSRHALAWHDTERKKKLRDIEREREREEARERLSSLSLGRLVAETSDTPEDMDGQVITSVIMCLSQPTPGL